MVSELEPTTKTEQPGRYRSRRRPTFRKACRSRSSAHCAGIQRHRQNSRTCCEGPFAEVVRATYADPLVRQSLGGGGFRFSTKFQDEETGLLYYGYRYYDPSTGRWNSRDPLAEKAFAEITRAGALTGPVAVKREGLAYSFVVNAPVSFVDLLGLALVKTNDDGTISVKVEACEIVIVVDHGMENRNAYKFIFGKRTKHPSAAGFAGCYATDVNSAIPDRNRLSGSPIGGVWDGLVSPRQDGPDWDGALENMRLGARDTAKSWLASGRCCRIKITLISYNGKVLSEAIIRTLEDADKFKYNWSGKQDAERSF